MTYLLPALQTERPEPQERDLQLLPQPRMFEYTWRIA
jgi:hypothetical protein